MPLGMGRTAPNKGKEGTAALNVRVAAEAAMGEEAEGASWAKDANGFKLSSLFKAASNKHSWSC